MKNSKFIPFVIVALLLSSVVSNGQKSKEYFLNVNVVPLGPVPLAKFASQKKSASKIAEEKTLAEEEAKEKGEGSAPPTQGGRLVVVETPKDEKPPQGVYYKLGSDYIKLPCNLNAVGKPTRLPVKAKVLKFYTRGANNSNGKPTYKFLCDHEWSPEQEHLLITLTKPLKSKKWSKPKIKKYDLSPSRIGKNQVVVLNASQESSIRLVSEKGAKNLPPHGVSLHTGEKVIALQLAAIQNGKIMHPYKRFVPVKSGQTGLLLVYPVTPQEDYHCIKFIRSKIKEGDFRKANTPANS